MTSSKKKPSFDDRMARICRAAAALVAKHAQTPLVRKIPVTVKTAERWLRERNILGLVMREVACDMSSKEDLLEDISEKLFDAQESLNMAFALVERLRDDNDAGEVLYEAAGIVVGEAYQSEGYNPLSEDDDTRFVPPAVEEDG